MRDIACIVAAVIVTAAARSGVMAAVPSLKDVLARAGEYSVSYGSALTSIVADEDFLQELVLRRDGTVFERRRLESEIAFVTLADTVEWLAFRSVLRVDEAAVENRAGPLERIFREAPRSALAQARAITAHSARHNLGPVERNFNVPTTVLHFLLPQHQDRFRFRKVSEAHVEGDTVWVVDFRERDRGTLIRTPGGRDAPAHGRVWIAVEDGRVLRTQLMVKADVEAEINVAWRRDDRLAMWVPAEMREHYRGPWPPANINGKDEKFDVRGVAAYSNYRRFEVDFRIVR